MDFVNSGVFNDNVQKIAVNNDFVNVKIKFTCLAVISRCKCNYYMMYSSAVTVRRIDVLIRILSGRKTILGANTLRAYSSEDKVTIGDVSKEISSPKNAEYVPRKYCKFQHRFLTSLF